MLCWSSHEEIPHAQGKRNPSKMVGVARGHQRANTLKPYSQKTSQSNHTRTTASSNSMKLSHAHGATQDGRVMVERSDRMWSTGEGNGKPLQYSCLENPMNSMKRQNDRILKEELPRSVGPQYATGDQWRNNFPKKGNAKECSNCHTIAVISHAGKVMLKILQARLQQYMNHEFPDIQAGFRKGRGTRDQIANIHWIIEKARVPNRERSTSRLYIVTLLI